jgi:hypothetical protein
MERQRDTRALAGAGWHSARRGRGCSECLILPAVIGGARVAKRRDMRASLSSIAVLLGALGFVTLTACGGGVAPSPGDGTGTGGRSGDPSSAANEPGGQGARPPGSPDPTAGVVNGGAATTTDCKYPVIMNPDECPPAYTREPPTSCTTIGLECWYPGAGDGDGRGCWSTALLKCVGDVDAGADGGPATGRWIGAQ